MTLRQHLSVLIGLSVCLSVCLSLSLSLLSISAPKTLPEVDEKHDRDERVKSAVK